jgi:hypothetical protein
MAELVPVDHDPFAVTPPQAPAAGGNLVPVDHDPFAAAAPAPQSIDLSSVLNFFKAIPHGALRGLSSAASAGGQAAQLEMGQPVDVPDTETTAAALEKNVTGELAKPVGNAGRYGSTVGEVLGNPASYVGAGGLPAKAALGTLSAVGSEAGGDLGALVGPKTAAAGRFAGAILGGNAPRTAARIVTPLPSNPTRAGLVNELVHEGVTPTAGQATGRPWLKWWEADLNPGINERQGEELTRAALRRVGEDAPRATPDVVNGAFTRIGGDFDRLSANNTLHADRRLGNDLVNTWTNYANLVPESAPRADRRKHYSRLARRANRGRQWRPARASLSGFALPPVRRGPPNKRPASSHMLFRTLRKRSTTTWRVASSGTIPRTSAAFERARRQYRNLMVVERAAAGAGEATPNGLFTPAQLAAATKAIHGKRAFVRGQGDFGPLARAAQGVLTALPDSGTSQRNRINLMLHGLGGLGGAVLGHNIGGGAEGSVLGLLAGEIAAPMVEGAVRGGARRAIMNQATQMWLRNNLLPDVPGLLATAPGQAITAGARSPLQITVNPRQP